MYIYLRDCALAQINILIDPMCKWLAILAFFLQSNVILILHILVYTHIKFIWFRMRAGNDKKKTVLSEKYVCAHQLQHCSCQYLFICFVVSTGSYSRHPDRTDYVYIGIFITIIIIMQNVKSYLQNETILVVSSMNNIYTYVCVYICAMHHYKSSSNAINRSFFF